MSKIQLARGIYASFAPTEDPFAVPNGMEANLRLIDDHLALYTLAGPVAPATRLPTNARQGAGQIFTDGSYAVLNADAWNLYPARMGLRAIEVGSKTEYINIGVGWQVLTQKSEKTYLTLEIMQADVSQAAGSQGIVANDPNHSAETPVNGYYTWTGAAWVRNALQPADDADVGELKKKTAVLDGQVEALARAPANNALRYGPELLAHEFTSADGQQLLGLGRNGDLITQGFMGRALQEILKLVLGKDALQVTDEADELLVRIERSGLLSLAGLTQPLQQTLFNLVGDDLLRCWDDDGNIYFRIDKDAEVYLVGMTRSLQEMLRGVMTSSPTYAGALRGPMDAFNDASARLLASSGHDGVPPMYCQLPTHRNLGVAWLGNVQTVENESVPVITPYNPRNGVVHPYIVEFFNGWKGYRYMLGLTGYTATNENEENPFLVAGNDLRSWDLVTPVIVERPDVPSGHNSDIALAYDPRTRELIVVYRQSIRLDGAGSTSSRIEDSLWCRRTRNLEEWTDPVRIFGPNPRSVEIVLSPTFVFDPTACKWHMYCVSSSGSQYVLRHYVAQSIEGPWWHEGEVRMPTGITAWHCDVRWVGDRLVALMHDNTAGNLYFGIATPGSWIDFKFNPTPVIAGPVMGIYKATFLPVFDDTAGQIAFDIAWTSNNSPPGTDQDWQLFINRTNFAPIA